ncbi:hypothetical protein YN1HA_10180 [Sulfurisphaera ohwakuensis]
MEKLRLNVVLLIPLTLTLGVVTLALKVFLISLMLGGNIDGKFIQNKDTITITDIIMTTYVNFPMVIN